MSHSSTTPTTYGAAEDPTETAQLPGGGRFAGLIRLAQQMVSVPQILALIVVVDIAAYFAGLLYWYGYVMADPATPWWVWPFIPDCPLFGLLGGLGLLMVVAQQRWRTRGDQAGSGIHRAQRTLWVVAIISLLIWLSTYLPGVGQGWSQQGAMFAVWSWSLVVGAIWFRRPPAWLLGLFAFGQIKYGIWTITAWLLYWRSTAMVFGTPHFSFDSVLMTITHVGLVAQGVLLLTYFRPDWRAALVGLVWFGVSDFVDYGLGFYPAIPEQFISLTFMQWSTIIVTLLLSAFYALWSWRSRPISSGSVEPASRAASSV